MFLIYWLHLFWIYILKMNCWVIWLIYLQLKHFCTILRNINFQWKWSIGIHAIISLLSYICAWIHRDSSIRTHLALGFSGYRFWTLESLGWPELSITSILALWRLVWSIQLRANGKPGPWKAGSVFGKIKCLLYSSTCRGSLSLPWFSGLRKSDTGAVHLSFLSCTVCLIYDWCIKLYSCLYQ